MDENVNNVLDNGNKQEVQSCPSYNPADLTNTAGMLDYIYRCNSMTTENCMPAIVESYDRKKNIVTVKPSINITAATGETIERESVTATVMSVCGNKFIMNFPLEKGDTGWLITADRDISLFREQRKVINANTNRIHSIEDSFFIPDRVNDFKIDDEDKDNFVLQSLSRNLKITFSKDTIKIYAGPGAKDEKKSPETNENGGQEKGQEKEKTQETFISLTADTIKIHSTSGKSDGKSESDDKKQESTITMKQNQISIITTDEIVSESKTAKVTVKETLEAKAKNANISTEENLTATVKKDCSVKADGNVNIKAPNIKIEGNVSIQGNVNASGKVTASDCIGRGKSLASHVHGGVESGSSTTGGPQ